MSVPPHTIATAAEVSVLLEKLPIGDRIASLALTVARELDMNAPVPQHVELLGCFTNAVMWQLQKAAGLRLVQAVAEAAAAASVGSVTPLRPERPAQR